ncbi:MAG: ArsR/SmtB family transcription factor [Phycisphaerae bacterium]
MASKSDIQQARGELCDLFHVLSDQTRLQIVMYLASGEHSVMEICEHLDLPQPTISHHLRILRMNRLVVDQRTGKSVTYTLDDSVKHSKHSLKFSMLPYSVVIDEAH